MILITMKQVFFSVLISSILLFAYSCSKSKEPEKEKENENEVTLVTYPDADAAHDEKSGGVYKGVIIGSTGTVKIILQHDTISAEVTIDGETKVMTPQNMPVGWTSGYALEEVVFAADDWTLTFSVSTNGHNPYVSSVSIPGHTDVAVHIVKEQSTTLVRAFEGSFGKGDSIWGTMNFVLVSMEDTVFGIIQNPLQSKQSMYGFYSYNIAEEEALSLHTYFNINGESFMFSASGVLREEEIQGLWKYYDGAGQGVVDTGVWEAKRTL